MAKLTLADLTSLTNQQSAVSTINSNSALIETALENTLSRDGTTPNEMESDLDMNGNRILNLPEPLDDTEPLRLIDAQPFVDAAEAAQAAAELALDSFTDLYLGVKASDPALDNDNNALQQGAMYFNSVEEEMRVYGPNGWVPVASFSAYDEVALLVAAAEAARDAAQLAETNAETAETNAETAETNAELAETNAETAASNAATSESNAATSASTATTQAGIATTQAGIATTQAGIATTQAGLAAASYDSFDDRYLGAKSADPTLDNDGNALLTGALYFNDVADALKVYDGATWLAYSAASGIGSVNDDPTPTLGGNLVLNSNDITGTGDINITGTGTFTGVVDASDVTVDDEAYGVGWNTSLEVPTKNAVYDKIESILDGQTFTGAVVVPDDAYAVGWNGSTEVPTKNALYDKIETLQPLDSDLTDIAALSTTAAGRSILTLADPNADRLIFWDDSAGALVALTLPTGLTITSTTLSFADGPRGQVALTDGATPALDASLGNVFTLSAAGNRTIAVPSNPTAGQKIIIRHEASGGARTLALNTGANGFRFGTDITALTETGSGLVDWIGCIWNDLDSKWDVVAYAKGY